MVETHLPSKPPLVQGTWGSLLILVGFILIGMTLGSILGMALISVIWGDGNILAELNSLDKDAPGSWAKIMTLQAVSHIFTFLLPSLAYWRVVEQKKTRAFYLESRNSWKDLVPIFFLTIVLMPFTGLVAEWNESMSLPAGLSGIEQWMKENEATLARLTEFLISFDGVGQLLLAIIVIAVIPAIGEEILFRGILQRKLAEHWANVHLAIWISATVFSAIHFQFYGFFPRLFLGAMFGYLYFWTGRLSMAIFAHFVNNAVTVLLIWLNRQKLIGLDISSVDSIPIWISVLSLLASVWLLRVIYKASPESKVN